MTLVDSHCHLDDKQFQADRDAVIQRAREAGVSQMLSIGTGDGPPDLGVAVRVAELYPFVYATVGVHPHNAAQWNADTLVELRSLAKHAKVVAIGEIGLDYHYDFSPRDRQKQVFIEQMNLARECGLPIIIHTREAWEDTFALLAQYWTPGGLPGVMHCFTGGPEEAQRSLELGFHLGFGGVTTYPKATGVHEAARMTPLNRLLVETDAPYLAPTPHRGKRNEPAYVVQTARRVAELRGETLEQVASATTENFRLLFPTASNEVNHGS